jgi:hypothetical protein
MVKLFAHGLRGDHEAREPLGKFPETPSVIKPFLREGFIAEENPRTSATTVTERSSVPWCRELPKDL